MAQAKKDARKPATEKGAAILKLCVELHGSLYRAARVADVHYVTLCRRVYETPSSIDNDTITKFEKAGIPRALLLP